MVTLKKVTSISKLAPTEREGEELVVLDCDSAFSVTENSHITRKLNRQLTSPGNLNDFDITASSVGFDLSGLFEDKEKKKEVQFTSNRPASTIIPKLEVVAKRLRLKIRKKDGGLLKLEDFKVGRKGFQGIDVEIFKITPSFHLIEMKIPECRYLYSLFPCSYV